VSLNKDYRKRRQGKIFRKNRILGVGVGIGVVMRKV
jgi:hypothetical protein